MTTPRIRGASARDVTEARALAEKLHPPSAWGTLDMNATNAVRDWMAELIAAALSEREAMTVEACCKVVCADCRSGLGVHEKVLTGRTVYFHVKHHHLGGVDLMCIASDIRADAARRESE